MNTVCTNKHHLQSPCIRQLQQTTVYPHQPLPIVDVTRSRDDPRYRLYCEVRMGCCYAITIVSRLTICYCMGDHTAVSARGQGGLEIRVFRVIYIGDYPLGSARVQGFRDQGVWGVFNRIRFRMLR